MLVSQVWSPLLPGCGFCSFSGSEMLPTSMSDKTPAGTRLEPGLSTTQFRKRWSHFPALLTTLAMQVLTTAIALIPRTVQRTAARPSHILNPAQLWILNMASSNQSAPIPKRRQTKRDPNHAMSSIAPFPSIPWCPSHCPPSPYRATALHPQAGRNED